jgi:hypothetical protein
MELAGRDAGEHAQGTTTLDAEINIVDGGVRPKSLRQTLDTPHAALHDVLTILVAGRQNSFVTDVSVSAALTRPLSEPLLKEHHRDH